MVLTKVCQRALTLINGPCTVTIGPLLKGRKTRCPDRFPVARLVSLQQPVADQQRDTTLADLDRRDYDNAPGTALTEAPCTGVDAGSWIL